MVPELLFEMKLRESCVELIMITIGNTSSVTR